MTTYALSLDENYRIKEAAKKAKNSGQLFNLIVENAIMIPAKLLIFLQPNSRFANFDVFNFLITFMSLTVGINQLIFEVSVESRFFCCSKIISKILALTLKILISQLAVILVYATFYVYFTSQGVLMSDNFV